jgi:hypothetical protein
MNQIQRVGFILATLPLLAGCGRTDATQPDSTNPVHCIAALTYEMILWDKVGNHPEQFKEGLFRMMVEENKSKAQGHSHEEIKAAVLAFAKANAKEPAVMHRLAADCLAQENADPSFQREKQKIAAFMSGNPA